LPGCDEEATAAQGERMRAALAAEPMSINDDHRVITCSFGATCSRPGLDIDSEALIRVADDALYAAKRQGRNCVVFQPAVSEPENVIS